MKIEIEYLTPFPENSNPYHHDEYNMGETRGCGLELMYSNHGSEICKFLILVDKHSGKRVKISIEYDDRRDSWNRYRVEPGRWCPECMVPAPLSGVPKHSKGCRLGRTGGRDEDSSKE